MRPACDGRPPNKGGAVLALCKVRPATDWVGAWSAADVIEAACWVCTEPWFAEGLALPCESAAAAMGTADAAAGEGEWSCTSRVEMLTAACAVQLSGLAESVGSAFGGPIDLAVAWSGEGRSAVQKQNMSCRAAAANVGGVG